MKERNTMNAKSHLRNALAHWASSLFQQAIISTFLLLTVTSAEAQSGSSLPVYQVLRTGLSQAQAFALAGRLDIPTNSIQYTNREIFFIDPANFLAVPTMPVTDPTITSNLLAQSPNKIPGIPIKFEQFDFAALNSLTVISSNTAVSTFANALANEDLAPQSAVPEVRHTLISAVYTNDSGAVFAASNYLDTKVNYQFNLGGNPLIGPGAQAQIAYGPDGEVTRLLYAARQLVAGPLVNIISSTEASNRAAALFPGFNGQISVQLVYYAPPLSLGTVATILPYYLCGGSINITNPWPYNPVSTMNLVQQLIPATDDATYVPSVTLTANPGDGGTQLVASASVSGGTPPYAYVWSGADPNFQGIAGPQFTNTPVMQVVPPQLSVYLSSPGSLSVSWVDPSGLFQLESAPNLQADVWSPLGSSVTSSNGISMTALNIGASHATFVRAVLTDQLVPATENVHLNIIDANGVFLNKATTLSLLIRPTPIKVQINPLLLIGWGTESPYDQDLDSGDTASWRKAMQSNPIFGQERFYRGTFVADRTDFIDPPGGNDNNIVDSADITFYAGHGNVNIISFTAPATGNSTPTNFLFDSQATHSWGNRTAEWLCLLSCDVLQPGQGFAGQPQLRWGPNFDGLHLMLGFSDLAYAGGETQPWGLGSTFEEVFIHDMSDPKWWMPIQKAWFNACDTTGPYGGSNLGRTGDPAVLAPFGPGGVSDINDYWWGKGSVGPRIRASQNKGWYFMTESN
jgi:Family of unknown function (DUF6345)